MPTEPHSEKIIDAVIAALKKIRLADGYWTEPKAVERYSRSRLDMVERPSLVVLKTSEPKDLRGGSSDWWDSQLSLEITGLIDPLAEEPQTGPSSDRLVALFQADVEKALGVEVDWTALRARLRRNDFRNILVDDPEDPEDGFVLPITIDYSHKLTDPSSPLEL